ncbi:MAG: ECF transporter S component, partial [Clostridiaceae bacterium]
MKKILIYSSVFMLILYFIYNKNLNGIIALGIIVSITILFIKYEKGNYGTKEISLLATLAGVAGGLRVLMAPFPNIQPTTFLVALTGYVFGPFEGFLVGALSAFISNMFLGQGPWTIFQMLGWGVVGFISGYLPSKKPLGKIKFSIILFFYGF